MPNSQPRPVSAEAVRSHLAGILPTSRVTFEHVEPRLEPLVLLEADHLVAGFGFSNGDIQKSYDTAYQAFKTHCAAQKGRWDSLDLAFVFCVSSSFPNIDQFCSNIETDVYFCRKFVVPLGQSLDSSLARLPFLPLTPVHGNALRPPSAQTFLQKSGVSAVLARYIVVQRERGPERIVEGCVNGEFGAPVNPSAASDAAGTQASPGAEAVRLEEITIKNFRAYRKEQTFPIGAGVTVLYGPNGFGKTSFFDAVDFAITGGIGRVETSNDAHFSKMAQHLDASTEESMVTLSFESKGVTRKICRTVKNRKGALMDGREADRKKILSELTGRDIPITDRVENFVNLFRATHLFNQELQELTKDFQDNCCLSSEIVSRMLAFQDYANALAKTERILDVLSEIIRSCDSDISELSSQIAAETEELIRLNQTSCAQTSTASLGAQFDELKLKLVAAGITPGSAQAEVATARRWRAAIASKRGECQNRIARLSGLTEAVASLPRYKEDLTNAQSHAADREAALAIVEEKRASSEAALHGFDLALAELGSKLTNAQIRAAAFEWHRVTKPVYEELSQKLRTIAEETTQIRTDIGKLRLAEQELAAGLRNLENRSTQLNEKLKGRRRELDALRALVEFLPQWQRNQKDLAAMAESDFVLQKSLESLQVEDKKLVHEVTSLTEDEQRLFRQVEEIDKKQSAYRSLLLQLQEHVNSSTCPLCGEEHGTQEDLLDRIQRHLQDDPANKARAELTDIRKRGVLLREALGALRTKQESTHLDILNSRRLRSTYEMEITAFNTAALQSGITFKATTDAPGDILQEKLRTIQKEVDQLEEEIKTVSHSLEPQRTNWGQAQNVLAARLADEALKAEASAQIIRALEAIQYDPRWAQLPIGTDQDKLTRDEEAVLIETERLKNELRKTQMDAEIRRSEGAILRKESSALRSQLQPLRLQIANLHRNLTEITAKLDEAKLPPNTTGDSLLVHIGEETRREEGLAELQGSVSNLEQALDAATTASVLSTLQKSVRDKEKAVEQVKLKRDRHKSWLNYFNSITKLLSDQQNRAISNFTDEYGPRTSIIQRRLRSVYGFDDIEIQSKEAEIRVRVKRRGEELRPTEYFSQSQQQTLMLGLFLTACISQTWSGFSPVFMDDPVTHFDDLNIYSFLDLIVGFIESESSMRQFVISTCDEKLLQLARQKFRHLGESAVFYRFDAIGEDGPVVERIRSL